MDVHTAKSNADLIPSVLPACPRKRTSNLRVNGYNPNRASLKGGQMLDWLSIIAGFAAGVLWLYAANTKVPTNIAGTLSNMRTDGGEDPAKRKVSRPSDPAAN